MSVTLIDGPAGNLEIIEESPEGWQETDPVAVCCHPHSLHGGSMQNKVVHILARTFIALNAKAVRFNFRGVGRSEGEFANGVGEQDDLFAVIDWVRQNWPRAPVWLAGFSFGAFVAALCHERINPQRLLLVAPAVDMYPEFKSLRISTKDWILVQGGQDDIVSSEAVMQWAAQQANPARTIFLEETGHFFHGQLNVVRERILAAWNS